MIGYKELPRERKGFLVTAKRFEKQPAIKKEASMTKEVVIENTILDRDDQLNLMAVILEQLGDFVLLDTPEFAYAKQKFTEIRAELGK